MTDAIRKKHEQQVTYTKEKQGNSPYLFQSIHSTLTIADVDALFAALDAERGKVERIKGLIDKYESGEVSGFKTAVAISAVFYGAKGGGDERK